jgi:hypothetical protein
MATCRQAPWSALAAVALVAVMLPVTEAQSPARSEIERWLRDAAEFSSGDLQALALGRAVARPLDTPEASEAAVAGAVVINAPAERLLAEFTHIETVRRGRGVLDIGAFGEPPSLPDLDSFSLTADELAALRRCLPGACDLKLPVLAIARLRAGVDWRSSSAPDAATMIMRQWLFERLSAYLRDGNAALGFADDKRPSLDLVEEMGLLLAHEEWLAQLAPHVRSHLSGYPEVRVQGASDSFYWARVDFGMKPTIRVSHASIHPTPEAPLGLSHVIATKQIYASHYLRAALELRLVFPRDDGGFLLVMASRSRNDGMTGLLGFVVRAKVRSRSRDGMVRYLQGVKATLESGRRGEVVGAP